MKITLPQMQKQDKSGARALLSKLAAIVMFLAAGGAKFLGAIFKIKGVASFLSMMVSILAYWWTSNLGLAGAILFAALLLVHEMGHYWTAKWLGIETSLPMFIPFIGALISLKEKPEDAEKEAWMALGGPVLGSIAAFACLAIYVWTGDMLWLWGASVGFILNLFNLLPVSPLDGGRIIGAVWRGFWLIGLAALLALALVSHDLLLMFLFVIALSEINDRWYEFKPEVWLVCALGSVAIAVWWNSYFVLVLTALLGVSYWSSIRARRHEIAERKYKEWLLEQAEGYLSGKVDFESSKEYKGPREEFRKKVETARARLIADLHPEEAPADLYFLVSPAKRLLIGSIYLGLAGLLTASIFWVHSLQAFL